MLLFLGACFPWMVVLNKIILYFVGVQRERDRPIENKHTKWVKKVILVSFEFILLEIFDGIFLINFNEHISNNSGRTKTTTARAF